MITAPNSIMTENDVKDHFLTVSLDKAESVSIVYPVNEKRGKTVLVPLHLRAHFFPQL